MIPKNRFTHIEIYDLFRDRDYNTPVRISMTNPFLPAFAKFSPNERYLLVSEMPRDGVNHLKLFDFYTERSSTW